MLSGSRAISAQSIFASKHSLIKSMQPLATVSKVPQGESVSGWHTHGWHTHRRHSLSPDAWKCLRHVEARYR